MKIVSDAVRPDAGEIHGDGRLVRIENPATGLKDVETRRADLASGKWDVFTGPIRDQSGADKVPAGKVLGDADLRRINGYVKGVDGSLPK